MRVEYGTENLTMIKLQASNANKIKINLKTGPGLLLY
jgi:hypothetical protein